MGPLPPSFRHRLAFLTIALVLALVAGGLELGARRAVPVCLEVASAPHLPEHFLAQPDAPVPVPPPRRTDVPVASEAELIRRPALGWTIGDHIAASAAERALPRFSARAPPRS